MSYIDNQIVAMRKNNSYISTIHKWVVQQLPMLDEQVCLARVLDVLDKNNLAVSQGEVRNAFNKFYHKDFHGDKQSYLAWMYKTFHVKAGTLVNSANVRVEVSKKRAISPTTEAKDGSSGAFYGDITSDKGIHQEQLEMGGKQ